MMPLLIDEEHRREDAHTTECALCFRIQNGHGEFESGFLYIVGASFIVVRQFENAVRISGDYLEAFRCIGILQFAQNRRSF